MHFVGCTQITVNKKKQKKYVRVLKTKNNILAGSYANEIKNMLALAKSFEPAEPSLSVGNISVATNQTQTPEFKFNKTNQMLYENKMGAHNHFKMDIFAQQQQQQQQQQQLQSHNNSISNVSSNSHSHSNINLNHYNHLHTNLARVAELQEKDEEMSAPNTPNEMSSINKFGKKQTHTQHLSESRSYNTQHSRYTQPSHSHVDATVEFVDDDEEDEDVEEGQGQRQEEKRQGKAEIVLEGRNRGNAAVAKIQANQNQKQNQNQSDIRKESEEKQGEITINRAAKVLMGVWCFCFD